MFIYILIVHLIPFINCQFEWQTRDNFDDIRQRLDKVNGDNCDLVNINELFLSPSTVTHVPDIKTLGIDPIYPNRTNLLQVHNLALARAFYYSYILQKASDESEPGLMYYYLSAIADVAANRFINASSVYFSPNMAFTPSYRQFFNKTMPLFAPRAYRADDFNDPYHLQGTSTLNTFEAIDLGAITNNSISSNYTNDEYKINEWYKAWLPDHSTRQDSKTTYSVHITYRNGTNETFVWHGPPSASDVPGPVKWNRPYFDCGRSNKWVFGASVPVPDIFPRHTGWRHIEIPRYVATVVLELDFERLDINQCPISKGNPGPNYFANTARCKNSTTECEPIHGYGFRRGGYQCRCRPSFRLPKTVRTPYLGEILERSTDSEYKKGYNCLKVGYLAVRTQDKLKLSPYDRQIYSGRIETVTGLKGNMSSSRTYDPSWVVTHLKEINANNCERILKNFPHKLKLRGDVGHGKEERFENSARMALRLANFISSFMQIVKEDQTIAEFRVPDRPLTEDQIIGEVLSLVIGDGEILGAGVLFARGKFPNRTEFAPYAYKLNKNAKQFYVDDLSKNNNKNGKKKYLNDENFSRLETRWSSNLDILQTFTAKINIRYNSSGSHNIHYDDYPLQYRAATLNDGFWSSPYFDCQGFHKQWIITYSVPFFGPDKIRSRNEFKGVVRIAIPLENLDINQCEIVDNANMNDYNAFANSHKCDRRSSRCVPIMRRKFESGGYKCECKQGFEYPFNDLITYFDGQVIESEYSHMIQDEPSRFDNLRCRLASGFMINCNYLLIFIFLFFNFCITTFNLI